MINGLFSDITGIAMAIVGVAVLYTLVSPNNKTSTVIQSASQGLGTALSAAMGGTVSNTTIAGL